MIGDIIASVRNTYTNGLLCDGSVIPNGEDYNELRLLVGNNVPDLRDRVLRGNRPGRVILSYESDTNKSHSHLGSSVVGYTGSTQSSTHTHSGGDHTHAMNFSTTNGNTNFMSVGRYSPTVAGSVNALNSTHTHGGGDHTHTMTHGHTLNMASDGGPEVLMKNISVNYFIIYKEVSPSVDMTKINEIYDFTQLLKQNLFNQECSKFLPYGTGLYASDDIKQISNMVFEKEDN